MDFFMRQNTNEQNRIKKYVYSLYLFIIVLILALPRLDWYIDKFNITSISYLGFLSRSSTKSDIIYIYIISIYIYTPIHIEYICIVDSR